MYLFISVLIAYFLSVVDTFAVFVPPASIVLTGMLQKVEYTLISILICGVCMGLGNTTAIYLVRRFGYNVVNMKKHKKLKRWQDRITLVVDNIAYYPIVLIAATGLNITLCTTFVLMSEVKYKELVKYLIVGRTLVLTFCVLVGQQILQTLSVQSVLEGVNTVSLIIIITMYSVVILYVVVKLIVNRSAFETIKMALKI